MPEPLTTPCLYTIPPSAPFLTTLARALLSGDLPLPGGEKPDPLTLPLTTIYLPTRRSARALREAFLAESGGKALLLPRIHALGDADEDAAIIFGADEASEADGALGASAIGALPRRLALMRMILAWGQAPAPGATEAEIETIRWVNSPGQASSLAADLGRLMDFVEGEEINFSSLDTLVPEDLRIKTSPQLTLCCCKILGQIYSLLVAFCPSPEKCIQALFRFHHLRENLNF